MYTCQQTLCAGRLAVSFAAASSPLFLRGRGRCGRRSSTLRAATPPSHQSAGPNRGDKHKQAILLLIQTTRGGTDYSSCEHPTFASRRAFPPTGSYTPALAASAGSRRVCLLAH